VKLVASVKDVRLKSDLSDYAGELSVTTLRRITDKDNSVGAGPGSEPATTPDMPLSFTVPCATTADTTIGSECSIATTANTLVPGQVKEEKRSNWLLGQVQVFDGGADADADTASDNTLFMDEGIFVHDLRLGAPPEARGDHHIEADQDRTFLPGALAVVDDQRTDAG